MSFRSTIGPTAPNPGLLADPHVTTKPLRVTSGVSFRKPYATEREGNGRLSHPWTDRPYDLGRL